MKGKLKVGDIVIVAGVLLGAFLTFALYSFGLYTEDGSVLIISSDEGKRALSLLEDTELEIESGGYKLTVLIEDEEASVAYADCPDKTCVHSAGISKSGQMIACVPAGVTLRVSGEGAEYDFIAG